jgi:hypothetical protein
MFPPANPDTHPSRQVERIREILVGRQLESVERRLDKLETTRIPPMPTAQEGDVFMICLEVFEKRHNLEIQEIRDGMAATETRNAAEIRRLATQIQSVAKGRTLHVLDGPPELEQRLGQQIQSWQTGMAAHLGQRESFLINEFRGELQKMRDWVTSELESRDARRAAEIPAVHESLSRLASAAREFVETAARHAGPSSPAPSAP